MITVNLSVITIEVLTAVSLNERGCNRIFMQVIPTRNIALALMLILSTSILRAETVTLVSDEWCPYSCQSETMPGIGIEIAQKIFSKHDIGVTYQIINWQESSRAAVSGQADVLVGTGRAESPELIFPKYHFSYTRLCFISNDSDWLYQSIESLANKNMGVVKGYDYGAFFNKVINGRQPNQSVHTFTSTQALMAALNSGEVDVIVDDKNVVRHLLKKSDLLDQYQYQHCSRSKLFFAFSPVDKQKAERLIDIVDKELFNALTSGAVKRFINFTVLIITRAPLIEFTVDYVLNYPICHY